MSDLGDSGDFFEKVEPGELRVRSCTTSIYGMPNSGRTTLALTMPGDVCLCSTSEKVDGIVEEFAKRKDIYLKRVKTGFLSSWGEEKVIELASQSLSEVEKSWSVGVSQFRTFIMDTHTDAWSIARHSEFGDYRATSGRIESNYGGINVKFRALMALQRDNAYKDNAASVILIGAAKEKWIGFDRTGRYYQLGNSCVDQLSDVVIFMERDEVTGKIFATIKKPWFNAAFMNVRMEVTDEIDLPLILSMISKTSVDDWR